MSNQPGARLHGQLDPAPLSMAQKVKGREPLWINPFDAVARCIRDGDLVRVHNDRGSCLAGAHLTDAIRAGVVQLATGAWYDPAEPRRIGAMDKYGNPNVLTLDTGTSKLAQAPTAHSLLVEAERWVSAAPAVTAHEPPVFVEEEEGLRGSKRAHRLNLQ